MLCSCVIYLDFLNLFQYRVYEVHKLPVVFILPFACRGFPHTPQMYLNIYSVFDLIFVLNDCLFKLWMRLICNTISPYLAIIDIFVKHFSCSLTYKKDAVIELKSVEEIDGFLLPCDLYIVLEKKECYWDRIEQLATCLLSTLWFGGDFYAWLKYEPSIQGQRHRKREILFMVTCEQA